HALAIERHLHLAETLVLHGLGPAGVACRLVGPGNPGEHDGFAGLGLNCAVKVGQLSFGYVVAPCVDAFCSAAFPEDRGGFPGVLEVLLLVRGGNGGDHSVDVAHCLLPCCFPTLRAWREGALVMDCGQPRRVDAAAAVAPPTKAD